MDNTDNYTKKSAKNVSIGIAAHLISNLLSFIARTVFIQCLSTEYLGINGLFSNVLTLLSFAELGIGEALVYSMYKPMKEHDENKLKQLLTFYKKAYRWISVIIFLVGFILSFFMDVLVAEKPNISENFQVIFWLFLLNNIISYLLVYKQSLLMVDQKKYVISLVRLLVTAGQVIAQSIFLYLTHNYYIYLLCQIAGTVTVNIVVSVYTNRHYSWVCRRYDSEGLDVNDKKRIFKDIKALSISKVAGMVSNGSDNIIISKMFGLASVGYISNYNMVINAVNGLVWTGLVNSTGSIGQFNVDSTVERKRRVFNELFLLTYWIYAFVCICLAVLLNPFVTVWLGSEYLIDQKIIIALVFVIYIGGVNFPFYSFRVTCGMFDPMKYNYVYYAALNVVMSIFLGFKFGVIGVYAATSISRLLTAELKEGKIVFEQILKKRFGLYLAEYGLSILLLCATYFLTEKVVGLVTLTGWVGLLVKGIVCVIMINSVFAVVFCRSTAFKNLIKKVIGLFSRNRV